MATIGTFTKTENGFTGTVKTLSLNVKTVKFVPVEGDSERGPDFRIFRVQRILVRPGRRPPARRSANISPSSWTIRASPRQSMPAWSRPRAARATTSSGLAATAIEADQPRSPAHERGFVMFMAAPPIRNMAIRMVGCQVLRLAHPDQILLPGLRWRSCRMRFARGALPPRGARDR
jgi:Protein of unknown function (DUF736)